jgi:hypothetical protein
MLYGPVPLLDGTFRAIIVAAYLKRNFRGRSLLVKIFHQLYNGEIENGNQN